MGEKTFKYTSKISQPQKVAGITLNLKEGTIKERELKALKKDAYGASLLEKGLLVIGDEVTEKETASKETVPEIETTDEA